MSSVAWSRSTVSRREAEKFRAAYSGGEQQRQHAVAFRVVLGRLQHPRDFVLGVAARFLVRHARRRGIGRRIMRDQFPFAGLFERGVQHTVTMQRRSPRQRPRWLAILPRCAALFHQRRIKPVEIERRQLFERDPADVVRGVVHVALVAFHGRRGEVLALAKVRQPAAQIAGKIMLSGIADAAAFDLGHLDGVGLCFLLGREVL